MLWQGEWHYWHWQQYVYYNYLVILPIKHRLCVLERDYIVATVHARCLSWQRKPHSLKRTRTETYQDPQRIYIISQNIWNFIVQYIQKTNLKILSHLVDLILNQRTTSTWNASVATREGNFLNCLTDEEQHCLQHAFRWITKWIILFWNMSEG